MPFDDNDRALLHTVNEKLDRLGRALSIVFNQSRQQEGLMARNLDEISAYQDEILAKVRRNRDYDQSVAELVRGQKQTISDLKDQLDKAVQAGDMNKVQAVSDKMDEINAALDEDEAVSAVNENATDTGGAAGMGGEAAGGGGPAAGGAGGPAAGATS